jgi:hypothetical protein
MAIVSAWAALLSSSPHSRQVSQVAFSATCDAMLCHLLRDPIHVVGILIVCSIAGQGMTVWSVRRDICWRS